MGGWCVYLLMVFKRENTSVAFVGLDIGLIRLMIWSSNTWEEEAYKCKDKMVCLTLRVESNSKRSLIKLCIFSTCFANSVEGKVYYLTAVLKGVWGHHLKGLDALTPRNYIHNPLSAGMKNLPISSISLAVLDVTTAEHLFRERSRKECGHPPARCCNT